MDDNISYQRARRTGEEGRMPRNRVSETIRQAVDRADRALTALDLALRELGQAKATLRGVAGDPNAAHAVDLFDEAISDLDESGGTIRAAIRAANQADPTL
jgi:hypothetical protein